MNDKIKVELGPVQKTLFMPVWARAAETQKQKPFIRDYEAVKIINTIDFDFTPMAVNLKEINLLSWIARCKRYDMVIEQFIKEHPDSQIVNIGCGLDTTFDRAIKKPLMWYDIDLPDVIDLRKKFLPESENRKFIAGSFLEDNWCSVISTDLKTLIISAGVFVYFEESEIKDFLLNIADRFNQPELLFDVTSPRGKEIANQVISASGLGKDSWFKWGLADKNIIEVWDPRIKIINTYYTFRLPGLKMKMSDRIMGYISDAVGVQYMVHIKIENK